MWGFGSSSQGSNGGAQPGTPVALPPKDPVGGFGYPPTPPIDLKSSTDNHHHQHLQSPVTQPPPTPSHHHQDYLQPPHSHHQDLVHAAASSEAANHSLATLPSLSSIEAAKSDHLMSTLGFPSYITASTTASSVNSRKFQEGNTAANGIMTSTGGSSYNPTEAGSVASSAAYPYFTSPGADLYSGTAGYNSSSAVFSSKTLQPTRPRTKSRANAGKRDLYRKGGGSSLYIFQHFFLFLDRSICIFFLKIE